MEHPPTNQPDHIEPDPELAEFEHEATTPPRIYVASLSDYNAGRLHGTWINADQDPNDIHTDIQQMLARSPEEVAEEWAIHDYEGFAGLHLHEYESIDTVAHIGQGIGLHGEAFAHWAALIGTDQDLLDEFEERYRGVWPSIEEYASDMLDDLGIDTESLGPDWLSSYIRFDLEAFARDLSVDLYTAHGSDGVFVFDA